MKSPFGWLIFNANINLVAPTSDKGGSTLYKLFVLTITSSYLKNDMIPETTTKKEVLFMRRDLRRTRHDNSLL